MRRRLAFLVLIFTGSCSAGARRADGAEAVLSAASFPCAQTDSAWNPQNWSADPLYRERSPMRWYNDAGLNTRTGTPADGYAGGSQIAFMRPRAAASGLALYQPLDSTGAGPEPDTLRVQWRDPRTGQFALTDVRASMMAPPAIDSLIGVFRCDSVIGVSWRGGRAQPESLAITAFPF